MLSGAQGMLNRRFKVCCSKLQGMLVAPRCVESEIQGMEININFEKINYDMDQKKTKEELSEEFGTKMFILSDYLAEKRVNQSIITQILKSGTSIGANIAESKYAESSSDFIHKLSISQKECNETLYWLKLLYKSGRLDESYYNELNKEAGNLLSLITYIIRKMKAKY